MVQNRKKIIATGIISNAIESFDLSIYAFFTLYLAGVFFPHQNTYTNLLKVFSIFLFGYLSRPIGSIIFGYIGDEFGRKKALLSSSILMMISTGLIGSLPSYESIGYFSPCLLLILRICQGISYGGEYTGSVIYLVEHAGKQKTNTFGSYAAVGSNLGILISSLFSLFITMYFTTEQITQGIWRIPFLLSFFFSMICFSLRTFIEEPSEFKQTLQTKNKKSGSLAQLLKSNKKELGLIFTLTSFGIVITYLLFINLTTYLVNILNYEQSTALLLNTLAITLLVTIIPFAGKLTDKWGRKKIIPGSIISLAILILPYLHSIAVKNYFLIILLQITITIPAAFYFATVPVFFVEMIKVSARYRTVSIGYNLAAAIFGGTMPLIVVSLVEKTQMFLMPGLYLAICALITLLILSRNKNYLTIST